MDGACQARKRAPGRYPPRRPSESVLHRCVRERFIAPARDPPLWDLLKAASALGKEIEIRIRPAHEKAA